MDSDYSAVVTGAEWFIMRYDPYMLWPIATAFFMILAYLVYVNFLQ